MRLRLSTRLRQHGESNPVILSFGLPAPSGSLMDGVLPWMVGSWVLSLPGSTVTVNVHVDIPMWNQTASAAFRNVYRHRKREPPSGQLYDYMLGHSRESPPLHLNPLVRYHHLLNL